MQVSFTLVITVVTLLCLGCSEKGEIGVPDAEIQVREKYAGIYKSDKSEWVGADSLGNRIIQHEVYFDEPDTVDFVVTQDTIYLNGQHFKVKFLNEWGSDTGYSNNGIGIFTSWSSNFLRREDTLRYNAHSSQSTRYYTSKFDGKKL